jgi:low temperature requirement protein LtrA
VTDALIDRFGQLTIIVLGETITEVVGGLSAQPERTATVRWMFGHLPLTAAIAAMGAAMVSLVDHAHAGRTPVATVAPLQRAKAPRSCART